MGVGCTSGRGFSSVCTPTPPLVRELVTHIPDATVPPTGPDITALLPLEPESSLGTVPETTPVGPRHILLRFLRVRSVAELTFWVLHCSTLAGTRKYPEHCLAQSIPGAGSYALFYTGGVHGPSEWISCIPVVVSFHLACIRSPLPHPTVARVTLGEGCAVSTTEVLT